MTRLAIYVGKNKAGCFVPCRSWPVGVQQIKYCLIWKPGLSSLEYAGYAVLQDTVFALDISYSGCSYNPVHGQVQATAFHCIPPCTLYSLTEWDRRFSDVPSIAGRAKFIFFQRGFWKCYVNVHACAVCNLVGWLIAIYCLVAFLSPSSKKQDLFLIDISCSERTSSCQQSYLSQSHFQKTFHYLFIYLLLLHPMGIWIL